MPGKTPRHSEEFKRDAVALVRCSGKTVSEVARDLGVSAVTSSQVPECA